MISLSVLLPPTQPPDQLAQQAQHIEQAGLAGIWVADHLTGGTHFHGPWYGALTTLTTILHATQNIRCGTLVASALLRPAPTLALEMTTLQSTICWARLTVAIGAGAARDATILGTKRPDHTQLETYAQQFQQHAPTIPLLLAADSHRSVQAATRLNAGWVTTGGLGLTGPPKLEHIAQLRHTWDTHHGTGYRVALIDIPEPSPWQTPQHMAQQLALYRDLGFDEMAVFPPEHYAQPAHCTYQQAARLTH